MENMQDVVMYGASLAMVTFVLVSQMKRTGLKSRYAGWAAIITATLLVGLNELVGMWPAFAPLARTLVLGVSVAALAMGIYGSNEAKPGGAK
jgi:hypothetical protein